MGEVLVSRARDQVLRAGARLTAALPRSRMHSLKGVGAVDLKPGDRVVAESESTERAARARSHRGDRP